MSSTFAVKFNEDSSVTLMGRVTASNASGLATGAKGEGLWLLVEDIASISYDFFDLDADAPDTPVVDDEVLAVADVILDVPDATDVLWTKDTIGYNFITTLPASYFAAGNNRYRVEFKFTLVGGEVFHGSYEGQTDPLRGS
jgi:hypothetical protein